MFWYFVSSTFIHQRIHLVKYIRWEKHFRPSENTIYSYYRQREITIGSFNTKMLFTAE